MDDTLGFIRKITRIVVTILVVGVVLNDGARLATTITKASDGLTASMNAALASVTAAPNDVAAGGAAAAAAAASQKVTLENYSQIPAVSGASNKVKVTLTVSAPLERTLVAGPIVGAMTDVPNNQWLAPGAIKIKLRSTKEVDAYGAQ